MKFYIGRHSHRHGESTYLFQVQDDEMMSAEDFAEYLGDELERDRDDEFFELELATPIEIIPGEAGSAEGATPAADECN